MSDYYSEPVIETQNEVLPPPESHSALGEDSKAAIESVKEEIYDRIANTGDTADDYVEETKDRQAEERGEKLSPEREKARLERYQKALEAAGDEFDHDGREYVAQQDARQDEIAQRDHAVARNTRHEMRVEQFERQHPDYRQTVQGVFSVLPVGDHVAEALVESGRGPELAYAIAKRIEAHPDPIAAMNGINSMSPEALKLDLARIEGALAERDRGAQQQQPARRATRAPKPLSQVRGGSSGAAFDASTASMEEYAARRAAGWKG